MVDAQIRIGQARGRCCKGCGHIWQNNIRSCAKTHTIWGKPQDLAISPDPPPDLPISLGVVGIEDLGADLGKLPDLGGS